MIQTSIFDKLESQEKRILSALKSGAKLTQLDMLYRFGAGQAGTRIFNLRRDGHNIQTKMVTRNGKRVALYYMPKN